MMFTLSSLRILLACIFFLLGGAIGNAEEPLWPGFEEAPLLDKLPSGNQAEKKETDPLPLDNLVISILTALPATLNKWEKNHFLSYLGTVCVFVGLVLGSGLALLAHLNAPPHGKWADVRKKSLIMATLVGMGSAILLVTLHFSVPAHAKITYLVLALVSCSISAGVGCALGLSILRKLRILRAKKLGIHIDNERMWIR